MYYKEQWHFILAKEIYFFSSWLEEISGVALTICNLYFVFQRKAGFVFPYHWRIQWGRGGVSDARPSRSNFFHFHEVFGKNLANIYKGFLSQTQGLVPPSGKSWICHCLSQIISGRFKGAPNYHQCVELPGRTSLLVFNYIGAFFGQNTGLVSPFPNTDHAVEFFTNYPQYKNANFANFVLLMPLDII